MLLQKPIMQGQLIRVRTLHFILTFDDFCSFLENVDDLCENEEKNFSVSTLTLAVVGFF